MELLKIKNKAVVLGYVITASFLANSTSSASSWLVLSYLIYISMNIAIPIFKKPKPKQLLIILSAVFVFVIVIRLDPLFILLLPINVYELVSLYSKSKLLTLLCMLLPLPFVPHSLIPLYLLSVLLSYLLCMSVYALHDKNERHEIETEKMREDLQRLTQSLNENKEYSRQSEYMIKLEERNRLSQQIHDDIGHSMAGGLIQMEASRRLLDTDREKASELLSNAIAISKEGLERIRLTLKDLKPPQEEMGINRLRLLIDELSAKESVTATLTYNGDLDVITPIQWKIMQQNATEAVTNALKYAKATGIHIEVQVLNKFIKSVVMDNGIGEMKVVKGLGILGMEERAASLGGTVIVDGTKGFSVTTLLPYESR
ncbi:sensor histidine kinase [Paenibacillus sp. Marseille-Q4541]|uniref:sensor histidine kinase n=1 Tax=Paenibacillus sp. Marseille-Q4541 TaxID=2831522 RepID=UPI001BA7840B|nr:sensor histidine kinase [Paenibacillus sp. Marseille-Q4541]